MSSRKKIFEKPLQAVHLTQQKNKHNRKTYYCSFTMTPLPSPNFRYRKWVNNIVLLIALLSISQVVATERTRTNSESQEPDSYDSTALEYNNLIPGHLRNSAASSIVGGLRNTSNDVDDESSLLWPWNRNKTSDNECSTFQNCTSCSETSVACHWCSKDDQCHAKGSWYGCAIGASCYKPSNDTVDNSCHSHKNCAECSLSSSLCHYCAFDDQCHAIGSLYGCSHGVNCYSNDRCERQEPEPISLRIFDEIGFIPLVLIIGAAMSVFCCSTILFAGANALKGAYDDITQQPIPPAAAFSHGSSRSQQLQLDPIIEEQHDGSVDDVRNGDCDDENCNDEIETPLGEGCNKSTKESDAQFVAFNEVLGHQHSGIAEDIHAEEEEEGNGDGEDEHQFTERLLPVRVTAHPDPSRLPTRNGRSGSGQIKCLMRTCGVWYFFTVTGAICFVASSILLFPKVPEVNVCSDEFAWKSIIDGLTSLKIEASFQILTSVENKNRLDIALEGVAGKFKHDGEEVGTFEIERTIVAASSISDVMVTCTVVPDKWEALGLIADYYKDELEFLVDVSGSVRIKGIGFSIPINLTDILVKANKTVKKQDRHLCACPQWKDLYPTSPPVLSFEEAVSDPITLALPTKTDQVEIAIH